MTVESVVLLVVAGLLDLAFIGLALGIKYGSLIDVITPYGTDTPERRNKIGRERARKGTLRMMYAALLGLFVLTAGAFFEEYLAAFVLTGLGMVLVSVAVFMVWYMKNTKIKK